MNYFPSLYQDETLYSGLARYHQRAGGSSLRSTLIDLFGVSKLCAVTDLPSHLIKLTDRIDRIYSPEELLMKHTLFPYYSTFLPKDISNELKKSMFESNSKSGKAHALAGLLASVIKHPEKLRYCPTCIKADTKRYGESYWHRAHQLPGVHLCPTHKEFLQLSSVLYTSKHHKHQFTPLSMTSQNTTQTLGRLASVNIEKLQAIADQSFILLKNISGTLDVEQIYRRYKIELQNRQLVNLNGGFRFQSILNSFKIYFGTPMLDILCCTVNTKSSDTWLHKLVREPQSVTHPLRHLLMMLFLDVSFNVETETSVLNSPFGISPWPCLNKAAEHYRQAVIPDCTVSYCSHTRKPIGTFKCSCGFIYARKGPDVKLEDRYRIGRIKEFGDVWRKKLMDLAKGNGMSYRRIGRELNVNSETVQRQLGLTNQDGVKDVKRESLSGKLEKRRVLLVSMNELENKTRASIKQRLPKEYNWLYRHDKEWLLNQLPKNNLRRRSVDRINWNERDEMLHSKLQHALMEIYNEQPPVRVTVTELGKHSGHYVWLEKKINLLPLCKQYIQENRESTEQFQIRRLEWAKESLLELEGTIRGWKLLKLAGIPNHYSLAVRDKIVEILKSYDGNYIYKLIIEEEVS